MNQEKKHTTASDDSNTSTDTSTDTFTKNAAKKIMVWDLPVRVFHWALVLLFAFSFYSGKTGGFELMDYHMLSGYAVLTLITFRIFWGFIGGQNARFRSFVRSPVKVFKYLRSLAAGQNPKTFGHNPAGGMSVIVMLLLLLGQGLTGLFTNDDIMLEGPLTHLVSYEQSRSLTGIHENISWLLVGFVSLHLIAILFYKFVKKEKLVKAMITGYVEADRQVSGNTSEEEKGTLKEALKETSKEGLKVAQTKMPGNFWFRGIVLLSLCSGLVYSIINFL
jgi:cytochrome b